MADIVTTRVFTDGEKGITASKMNDIIAGSSIQPSFVSSKPVAGSTAAGDNLLLLKSGGTYAQIDSSTFATAMVPLLPDPNPNIWSVRLRSFNATGNPTMEVDQRNVGALLSNPGSPTAFACDRWLVQKAGTMVISSQRITTVGSIVLPGTNFAISANLLRLTLTTQQTTLGAGDYYVITNAIEGPMFRELSSDVHSISLLVRSTVANLKFSVSLRDNTNTHSLVKLCTIPTANTFTLITLPNLPLWTASGNFSTVPGVLGYSLIISLAVGTTNTSSAADTWQTSGSLGAPGMDNFASKPVSSTFEIAFVQHEPGSQCSTLMDLPFDQNLLNCQRYYQKSYDYATAIGAVSNFNGDVALMNIAGGAIGPVRFTRRMAKVPTILAYSTNTGTVNTIRDVSGAAERPVTAVNGFGETGFDSFTATGITAVAGTYSRAHYTADLGW